MNIPDNAITDAGAALDDYLARTHGIISSTRGHEGAREILEAAAPFIAAQALRDVAEHKTAKLPSIKVWLHARADEVGA